MAKNKNRNRILEERQDAWSETVSMPDTWMPSDVFLSGGAISESYTVPGVQLDLFDQDKELRTKYPALQDAYDHYNNVKKMCLSKEKENNAY
jgi:hypothetical protein